MRHALYIIDAKQTLEYMHYLGVALWSWFVFACTVFGMKKVVAALVVLMFGTHWS